MFQLWLEVGKPMPNFRKKLAEDFPRAAWPRPLTASETEYSPCWSDCSFSEKAGSYSWPHRHLCEPRGESPCLEQARQQYHHQRGHHSPALLQVWGGDGADGVGVHGGGQPGERLRVLQQVHNVRSHLCHCSFECWVTWNGELHSEPL